MQKNKKVNVLDGIVERIVFRNEENGWTVLELDTNEELHKVVGEMPNVSPGEQVKIKGVWVEHPSFGIQFSADSYENYQPTGSAAILSYLSSGVIKGVGQATAIKIVEKFGDKTLEVIENTPIKLSEIKGISKARAKNIANEYQMQFGLREVMLAFSEYGLTPNEAARCWKLWGNAAITKIKENPYILCTNGLHIGFERADNICLKMNKTVDSIERLQAGIKHILTHNVSNGHTCLPANKLVDVSSDMLQVPKSKLLEALNDMVVKFIIREEIIDNKRMIFLNHLYRAEKYIANRILHMIDSVSENNNVDVQIKKIETKNNIEYAENQIKAITEAVNKGVFVLTGGPGTGKTTTIEAIITILEAMNKKVDIAAPTGRAAKRMTELTKREAQTIHRLLEVKWDDTDISGQVFEKNELNTLDCDAIIIDELSMVDVLLFDSLLRALKPECKLIMVGDADQLPAVGPGVVLQSIMGSNKIPVVQLTEVFRQALKSNIVTSAHSIVSGKMPNLEHKKGDFFFLPRRTSSSVVSTILDLANKRLPATYDVSVFNNMQILCPNRRGEMGTIQLNQYLQERLNPASNKKQEIVINDQILRCGDKIMHIRNNYDISWESDSGEIGQGIFNGDIGILESINKTHGTLKVRYDDRTAVYTREEAQDLELAYAITVHKSQGSEFEAVILPIFNVPPMLSYRNLLYTAVTRAKALLVVVGNQNSFNKMVNNNKQMKRYSGLSYFLDESNLKTHA